VKGPVNEIEFINPHALVYVDVMGDKGKPRTIGLANRIVITIYIEAVMTRIPSARGPGHFTRSSS